MEQTQKYEGNIITLFSTASAVGKTTIAVNLAAGLAKRKMRVCLVDLDMQFGDVCNILKITPNITIFDAQKVSKNINKSFKATDYLEQYTFRDTAFALLAAPLYLEQSYNVSTTTVKVLLASLRQSFDFIIVDTTTAFSELNLAVLDISSLIFFIGIVDFIPTIKNMKIGYDTMRHIGYDNNRVKFILNREQSKTSIDLEDVQNILGASFNYIIPNDFRAMHASLETGIPLVLGQESSSEVVPHLYTLVDKCLNLNDTTVSEDSNRGLGSIFKRLFK